MIGSQGLGGATGFLSEKVSDNAVNARGDLFASTTDGLYGSRTNGNDWERLGDAIGVLVVASDDHLVSVDRRDGELYKTSSAVLVSSQRDGRIVRHALHLEQNHPNPFVGETTVAFTLDQPASALLEVFDLTGRKVVALVDESVTAGRHSLKFNAGGLARGVYIYRLRAGTAVKNGKMVVE